MNFFKKYNFFAAKYSLLWMYHYGMCIVSYWGSINIQLPFCLHLALLYAHVYSFVMIDGDHCFVSVWMKSELQSKVQAPSRKYTCLGITKREESEFLRCYSLRDISEQSRTLKNCVILTHILVE